MFEIVKMTHVCQYWRSTLITYPRLWSSVFVRNDHKGFVAACLERSREVPLAVRLDLKHGCSDGYLDCTCVGDEWPSGVRSTDRNACRYHTTILPLLEVNPIRRIRTLDVHLVVAGGYPGGDWDQDFKDALDDFELFASPLPILESLSFRVEHLLHTDSHLKLPEDTFCWGTSPPTKLYHLSLHGCYGGPIWAVRNLTSFELAGDADAFDPIELKTHTFLPFISGSPSLVSLSLSNCSFPDRAQSSQVTPSELSQLKSLRLHQENIFYFQRQWFSDHFPPPNLGA